MSFSLSVLIPRSFARHHWPVRFVSVWVHLLMVKVLVLDPIDGGVGGEDDGPIGDEDDGEKAEDQTPEDAPVEDEPVIDNVPVVPSRNGKRPRSLSEKGQSMAAAASERAGRGGGRAREGGRGRGR